MRQRHHVARPAVVVQQQIGMRARHGRMGEGAGRLARPHRRVDPAAARRTARRPPPARARTRRRPSAPCSRASSQAIVAVLIVRQRRVAVPVLQLRQAEPARLQPVIAVRQARDSWPRTAATSASTTSSSTILERLREEIGAREVAPAVVDLLVLGQRVGDQREQRGMFSPNTSPIARPPPRAAPRRPVGQQVQRLGLRSAPRRRTGSAARRSSRRTAGSRRRGRPPSFSCSSFSSSSRELVRPERAQVAQPRPRNAPAPGRPASRSAPHRPAG